MSWISQGALNAPTGVLLEGAGGPERDRKVLALKGGGMWPRARGLQPPGAGRTLPSNLQGGGPADTVTSAP